VLIPRPSSLRRHDGEFVFDGRTRISAPVELTTLLSWLQSALRPATGLPLGEAFDGALQLALDAGLPAEGYRLDVGTERIRIIGGDAAGVFYGCQALLQLLPPAIHRRAPVAQTRWCVPCVNIEDAPRFAWRGAMLDVARHFMPKHDVLRFIDLMAMHRLNMLHLHLTEDQGWRVEIRRYPRLTEVGAWRSESQVGAELPCGPVAGSDGRPHGGYYTQGDIREIVAYAAERFVTVVPEIDVPGHSQAAIAAYPELGVTGEPLEVWTRWGISENVLNVQESTLEFYFGVFDEVMELFPSAYIGVGATNARRRSGGRMRAPSSAWPSSAWRTRTSCRAGSSAGSTSTSPHAAVGSSAGTRSSRAAWRPAPRSPRGAEWPAPSRRPGADTTWSPAPTIGCTSTTGSRMLRTSRSPSPSC
jgi:N-acetyl-beta-hexosaminidase